MSECDHAMIKIVRPNGTVYWKCKVCYHIVETNELEPDPSNSWGLGFEREVEDE